MILALLLATKLLIIHADDVGMSHSVNAATIKAFETGAVTSASIMVPCPWFPEFAAWARHHRDADLGLHLTLTSEWLYYRWGPLLSKSLVPSLVDRDGFLWRSERDAVPNIKPDEAKKEIRAQIERAREFGIEPTHLDTHMRTLHQTPELFAVLMEVAHESKIPAAVPRWMAVRPEFAKSIRADDIIVDEMPTIQPDDPPSYYEDVIRNLKPGLTELIIHVGYDDAELQAITARHPQWGAAWRQRDFDAVTGESFRQLLRDNDVKLTTWREVAAKRGRGRREGAR